MSSDELVGLKSNLGRLITFNSFLSTSADPPVSRSSTAVLFVIHVDLALLTTPVAFLGERKFLWGMNSVFRVTQIRETPNRPPEVTLTISSIDEVRMHCRHVMPSVGNASSLNKSHLAVLHFHIGCVRKDQGYLREALEHFRQALELGRDNADFDQLTMVGTFPRAVHVRFVS